jgi:hypothetical protein
MRFTKNALIFTASIIVSMLVIGGINLTEKDTAIFGAPSTNFQKDVIPQVDSLYTLGTTTKTWLNLFVDQICLNGDCQTSWAAGTADGTFSTTSALYFSSLGLAFSTTSADYWETQQAARGGSSGFSTTSANFWASVGLAFSTTSSDYWFTTKSVSGASTTLLSDFNTWSGWNTFVNATTTGTFTSGGQIAAPAGNTSAPGLSFSTDRTTGIFDAGSNRLGLAGAGVTVEANITREGDADTYLEFTNDAFRLDAGGVQFLTISEAAQDLFTINAAGADVDFTVQSDTHSDAIFLNGATGALTLGLYDCSGNAAGGVLTADASGNVTCTDDDTAAGAFATSSANYWASQGLAYSTTSTAYDLSTYDKGYFFSTTSANAWDATLGRWSTTSANYHASLGLAFSTTSTDYWLTTKSLVAFSTTSANYWASLGLAFSTTSANYYESTLSARGVSTTLLANTNTWSGTQGFANITATGATTTSLAVSNLSAGDCDVKSNGGVLYCGTDATGAGGGAWPFTPSTNYGVAVQSTSTPAWFTTGVQASSTSYFVNASTTRLTAQTIYGVGQVLTVTGGTAMTHSVAAETSSIESYADDSGTYVLLEDGGTGGAISLDAYNGKGWFKASTANNYGALDFSSITGSDKTFTFPNTTGTVCITALTCDGAFSTTSANYWSSLGLAFSTTSSNYWATQGLAFSTTSANYWETQQTARTADDLTNNSIEDLNDVAAMTENYGDLLGWNGSTWTDMATSSLYNTATGAVSGLLSSTDWTTFNNKQATISATFPIILSGATLSFGGLSTSTAAVQGNIPYFSGANTFANVATTALSVTAPITFSGTLGAQIGGSAGSFGCTTASGSTAGCLPSADWTSFNSRLSTTTVALLDKGIFFSTTSADAWGVTKGYLTTVDISANTNLAATYPVILTGDTLSVPATSTLYGNLGTGVLFNNAGTVTASSTLGLSVIDCVRITGSSALCDGDDATGGGGGAWPWTISSNFGVTVNSTSTPTWFTAGMHASGTSQFVYASSTAISAVSGFFTNLTIGADTLAEYISDTAGAFFTGNTETGITVTYQDADNTVDVVCDTASGSTFGCLASADWTLFNQKVSTSSIDTIAEVETLWGAINVIVSTEIDTCSEFIGILSGTGTCGSIVYSAGPTFTGTVTYANITGTNATSTTLSATFSSTTKAMFNEASTTRATIFSLTTPTITSAVLVAGSGGVVAAASTQTCTNQFVRALSAAYVATCATVAPADIDLTATFAWTGNQDFGGASFLEIPNGTAPTANDVGEIAHDTTDNQLILDDFVMARATQRIWSVTIASSSPEFISGGIVAVPVELDGYTMTNIRCKAYGGTSKIIAVEDESANSTEDITCATSVTSDDGTITNATVTAAEEMYIDLGATSGSVDSVSITVFGQFTRD